jgi:uncharacterized membrane protein YfcA
VSVPTFDARTIAVLFVSGAVAGTINSVAGGGSLVTFPTLLRVGILPVAANGTNTVALVPGSASAFWAYRDVMAGARSLALAMAVPSVVGGVTGALLALRVSDTVFAALVPWLILGATALFAAQGPLGAWVRRHAGDAGSERSTAWRYAGLALFQFAVAIYGGFFGAGIGILMLAALGLMGERDIHRMNALKNLAAVCINGVASVTFALGGKVQWLAALIVALGAITGGYGGAGIAQKLGQKTVRALVTGIGVSITAWMFYQRLTG